MKKVKPYYDLDTVVTFGKYEGRTMLSIYNYDLSYFKWFINTLNLNQMSDEVKNLDLSTTGKKEQPIHRRMR